MFHSLESGKAFEFCNACGLSLSKEADSYVVGKSYHRGECVFECALCDDCQERLHDETSEESREAISNFMESRIEGIRTGDAEECIWLLQHPPLYTAGTSADDDDLLTPDRFPVYQEVPTLLGV